MEYANNSYLYVFATYEEFFGVFPETAASVSPREISCKVISLFESSHRESFACVAGVGLVDFSAGLAGILATCKAVQRHISAVVNLGICGAYPESGIKIGDIVNVVSENVGDQGFQEQDGSFVPWSNREPYTCLKVPEDSVSIVKSFPYSKNLPSVRGLSVNCCTGTAETAETRFKTFGSAVESMEGAALFSICNAFGMPAIEIRAVSNIASTRDKSQWKIKEALENLRQLFM